MKEKGIKLLIIFVLLASVLMPFSISADTITSANIIGVNRSLVNTSLIESHTVNISPLGDVLVARYSYEYEITVQLDDYYLGYINGSFSTSLNDVQYSDGSIYNRTATKNNSSYYVNGNSFTTSFSTIACFRVIQGSNNDPTSTYNTTFTLNTSNVTKYQEIDSLESIISILSDIYQDAEDIEGLSTNQLTELQNIVLECQSLGLQLTGIQDSLDILTQLRQYNFPIESLTANYQVLFNQVPVIDLYNLSYWSYPVFSASTNTNIIKYFASYGRTYKLIIGSLAFNNVSFGNTNDVLSFVGCTIGNIRVSKNIYTTQYCRVQELEITTSEGNTNAFIYAKRPYHFMVFAFSDSQGVYNNGNISTEFALQFGLSNSFLDNINLIAQGSQQSQSAASGLESANTSMASDMNSMATIENGYSQDFNLQLQNIDFTNPIQQNQGILPAANFVISIFNGLISNNPFTVLIIIVCIMLIGKKVIGK